MKHHILISTLFCLLSANIFAQSNDQNYIRTRTYTTSDGAEYLDQIAYFDGLGRPNETVLRKITPDQKDLVSFLEYDNFGREYKSWLPAKIDQNNGLYVDFETDFKTAASTQYNSDTHPFVKNIIENSPLSRILGQEGAGADWEQHPTSINYAANTANEVPYFYVSGNNLVRNGNYAANTLYKTISADEDNKTATEFKDKLGRVVMTMQSTDHKTCYVYDDFGQLRYVLPPLATDDLGNGTYNENSSAPLEQYAYIYKYDNRGRQIYKRLPGCKPIYMVYDKADRLVMSQDGNQRKDEQNKKWTISTYDVFGRVLYSAQIVDNRTHNVLQNYFSTKIVKENFAVSQSFGYTKTYFPNITDNDLLIVNYYDNYNFRNLDMYADIESILDKKPHPEYPCYMNTKGLLTGSYVAILDNSGNFLTTAFYYDKKGRIVQQCGTNQFGYTIVFNKYDFIGNITTMQKTDVIDNNNAVIETYNYAYDHAGRLTKTDYSLNGGTPITLAENTYDDLSRLINKDRHNAADNERVEYNIKNWTKKIKSGGFEEILSYNTGSNPNFNGNISEMQWTNTDDNSYTYYFQYDELNRLKFGNIGNNHFMEYFDYDKHGNIEYLDRTYKNIPIDLLYMEYNGNQLTNATDYAGAQHQYNLKEYNPQRNAIGSFQYDHNGNLIYDSDRKIENIEYNLLNLPSKIFFKDGSIIINIYASNAQKLSSYYVSQVTRILDPRENTVDFVNSISEATGTHYLGNIEYLFEIESGGENIYSHIISNAEGYVQDEKYYYFRRDHLGNNREVWNATLNETAQITNYYPSGLPWYYALGKNPDLQSKKYNGKEFIEMGSSESSLDTYDYGARGYYAAIGRFTSIDPLAEMYYSYSPYLYCLGNGMKFIDPDGTSTHTDSLGHIVEVYNDGNMGVYKHNIAATNYDGNGLKSANGTLMGETEYWDEFIDPETGKVLTSTTIEFGESFDPIIEEKSKEAQGMDLMDIAKESSPNGKFDIKKDYENKGRLLNGKYATSRSAGNYLAGFNAANGKIMGIGISFETFQKLAGALHVNKELTTKQKIDIVVRGTSYGPPPAYGEEIYQLRMSRVGWQNAKKK
ncbi:MAG: DUF6443 domain-containing protein [Prevotellaceae bacterium]|nr:DUF6443 domain-containing protein [Prevotellaceae bacterium]